MLPPVRQASAGLWTKTPVGQLVFWEGEAETLVTGSLWSEGGR